VNATARDFRIRINDSQARGQGVDLSADSALSFLTDLLGLDRLIPWDIGAFAHGWNQLLDDDNGGGEFGAATGSDWVWSTNEVAIAPATTTDREIANPDPYGFDMTDIIGIWHLNEGTMI